eukprot:2363985-Rhodomonas_salina.1
MCGADKACAATRQKEVLAAPYVWDAKMDAKAIAAIADRLRPANMALFVGDHQNLPLASVQD